MSWYTAIFPNKEDFPFDKFSSIEEINKAVKDMEGQSDDVWSRISACVFATPYAEGEKNMIDNMTDIVNGYWDKYICLSEEINCLLFMKEIIEDETGFLKAEQKNPYSVDNLGWFAEDDMDMMDSGSDEYRKLYDKCKKEWRPSCSINHYEYSSNPWEGISQTEVNIKYVHSKFIQFACTRPSELVKLTCVDNIDELSSLIDELRDYLDREIYTNAFSKLCVKYWDTHKEG